ncbi:twin-arginine translocase TatA/TatE family subunit [Clostridium arbusti]|jgi:sec-independent protein translocase protein TatA|uniref:twin-arginine translocase TatA/TatE family subunit n=1 Tax=Clostridium arbusti TaxID=1137848 RepID=UPI000287E722|nr:twin-arginine translocase TatA/TatE family subunit [Clostridium arbusti]
MRLGKTEILLLLALALIFFGGGKLGDVGKSLGKSIKDFKEEIKKDDNKETVKKAEPNDKEKA